MSKQYDKMRNEDIYSNTSLDACAHALGGVAVLPLALAAQELRFHAGVATSSVALWTGELGQLKEE